MKLINERIEAEANERVEAEIKEKDSEYKRALSLYRKGASTVEEFTSQGISEDVAKIVLGIE